MAALSAMKHGDLWVLAFRGRDDGNRYRLLALLSPSSKKPLGRTEGATMKRPIRAMFMRMKMSSPGKSTPVVSATEA